MSNVTTFFRNTTASIVTDSDSPLVEKVEQCDYTFLFSHLHASIRHAHEDIINNVQDFQFEHEATFKLVLVFVCVLFGLFFAICGYRFLKFSTFVVGFSLGSGIIYLILSEQKQLSTVENLIISLSIGVLFAFVALLVQYIGLFLIGITSSISIVTCILILIDLFYTNQSAWVCIGLLFLCATILASFTLKFQKSLTIVNTSIIGSALLFIVVDFIVENNLLMDYIYELFKVNGHVFNIYERQKALLHKSSGNNEVSTIATILTRNIVTRKSMTTEPNLLLNENALLNNGTMSSNGALALFLRLYSSANAKLCWYTWCVFGSFFVILFFSLIIQFCCTGRRHDHRESWQKLIRGSRKKRTANLEKIRLKSSQSDSDSQHRHLTKHHHHHLREQNKGYASSTSCSSSQLELAATNQNDTLLLVESGCQNNSLSYTSSTSSETSTKGLNQKKRIDLDNSNDFEIVSFEIIKPTKGSRQKGSKSSSNGNKNKNNVSASSKNNNKLSEKSTSTATTTSTSSSASSNSSTCQLIPMKLNNKSNGSVGTASTTVGACLPNCPSSPKNSSSVTTSHHHGTLLPPPVPTLPPPKLPVNLTLTSSAGNKTDTINSALSLTNSILVPTLPGQLTSMPKLKHHRHSGATSSHKSDKSQSSDTKFRQLYQIRRNNGDVLSQDFLKNIQSKQSSSSQLNTNTVGSNFIDSNSFELRSASLSTDDKKKTKQSKQKKTSK